jgi:NAD(P)-dependent dehydrogenase (short-subunit alcohol dehydrogenase family)
MSTKQNRLALVTGASRGIGRAIAEALLADDEHTNVVICARKQPDLEQTLSEIGAQHGKRINGQICDVGDFAQVEALFQTLDQQFGRLDILVNNAGIGIFASVEQMSLGDWQSVINTNLNSLFYFCHMAIPRLRAAGGGYIFNIGSLAGKNTFPKGAAYSASKFGLIGFSETLMQEVRYDDIRVSYIMPGSVKTYFNHPPGSALTDEEWKLSAQDIAQVIIDLLHHNPRSLPSRVEIRPAKPPRK